MAGRGPLGRLVLVLSLFAFGCASASSRPRFGGRYEIECTQDSDLCLDEAMRVCPDGFKVLERDSSRGVYPPTNFGDNVGNNFGNKSQSGWAMHTYNGQMEIECTGADSEEQVADSEAPADSEDSEGSAPESDWKTHGAYGPSRQ